MRYYLIAGEASGDLHASNLVRELKTLDPAAEFRGWGGDLMQKQGVTLVRHYRDLAFMGFAEVVAHLPQILRNFRLCKQDIREFRPDVLILVDYPGFNLRMAKFAHRQGLKVFYYISPQLWAWRPSRVKIIKRFVDRMFVILPFEKEFYRRYEYDVDFPGHPLLDAIGERNRMERNDFLKKYCLLGKPIIAMFPGSRRMEIEQMLSVMASVIPAFPDFQFVLAAAPSIHRDLYGDIMKENGRDVCIVSDASYDLLQHAEAAMVTSGTATLETALFGVPQIVCYRGNPVSYLIAKQLVKVKYISLVNLVCEREVVPELIQGDFNTENLQQKLRVIIGPSTLRESILAGYVELRTRLGGPGASRRTGTMMVHYLNEK
jgi:lipid-A-disaccharide synthase